MSAIKTKDWLKANRVKLGLTQKQLAERTGLSIPAIAKIESGERIGEAATWEKILRVIPDDSNISYNSDSLIDEIKEEIELYGEDTICYLFYEEYLGQAIIITDYMLQEDMEEEDFKKRYIKVNLKEALELFSVQNRIIL